MLEGSSLNELVSRWHDLRQAGKTASPEGLCADCPQLVAGLRERLKHLAVMEKFLGPTEYGRFAIAFAVSVMINSAGFDWIRLSAIRFYSERARLERPEVRATLDDCVAMLAFIVSLVMMLGLLGTFVGLSFMVADIQRAIPNPAVQANATEWTESVSSLGRILAGKKTAFSATLVLRGSMTMSLAPRALAWLIRTAAAGHDTCGFVPHNKMQRA